MRLKLMLHYSFSFIGACLAIFIINIAFMGSSIYKEGALYNYHPEEIISSFRDYISLNEDGGIEISPSGIEFLEESNIGLQILNDNNSEVFQKNKPKKAPSQYSNVDLIKVYDSDEETLFLDEKEINGQIYTYLLFFNPEKIKRVSYTYDAELIDKAHKFPILIILNLILITIIGFLYTLKITKPINSIVDKIMNLAQGNYSKDKSSKGIYFKVEECINDLSDRLEENEKEREKLEELKEEWISNISHDIKTPLTSIIGNAEIMSDTEYELMDEVREKYCLKIISKGEYIKTLVEELNLSTRLKSNTIVLNKKNVNIVSLIRHVVIDIINDEKYNESNINFTYSSEEIITEVDEQLIKRAFINIIINAFVHNDPQVKVNINIQQIYGEKISISIEDNGKGVSEEELKHIFKRYYRGTNTRNKTEGSGLGMAIAHDIVKVHGGQIEAVSQASEGLKVSILL
ncbi:MAG: HAMP domain-containing sensor histidine kinase [Clostridium sp.]|nr:HAMP domain-containing sensor histidine kinase [Clostridium sp.]MDU7084214.1 HAMP domain-containing sensor histidine kinase [Clostridium sp.]